MWCDSTHLYRTAEDAGGDIKREGGDGPYALGENTGDFGLGTLDR